MGGLAAAVGVAGPLLALKSNGEGASREQRAPLKHIRLLRGRTNGSPESVRELVSAEQT